MDYRAKYDELDRYLFSIEYPSTDAPIRGRSILDLYRAFSIGGIVAFVGSGTSVLLGYDSWKTFAINFAGKALLGTKNPEDSPERSAQDNEDRSYCNSLISSLRTLRNRSSEPDWDPAAVLSLAREVARQRDLIGWYPPPPKDPEPSSTSPASRSKGAKSNTPTRHSGAPTQSNDGKKNEERKNDGKKDEEQKNNKAALESSLKEMFRIRHPGTYWSSAQVEQAKAPQIWRQAGAAGKPGTLQVAARSDQLRGLEYFGILERLPEPKDQHGQSDIPSEGSPSYDQLLTAKRPFIDSLACLRNEWQISRFVTVNYDLEIERVLEAYDFPFYSLTGGSPSEKKAERPEDKTPASSKVAAQTLLAREAAAKMQSPPPETTTSTTTAKQKIRADLPGEKRDEIVRSRLGEQGRSIDLSPDNAAELMLFAANYPSNLIQVIHLHGSVRDPSHMVVTDGDYNQRYYLPDGWAAVMGDGQELLFRGNAVVFVGVGMTEGELLRPLRLLAQAPGRESRPVFAFLESHGDADDTSVALKLYQRYGVRTIFVGTQLRRSLDPQFGSFSEHPLVRDLKRQQPVFFRCLREEKQGREQKEDEIIATLSTLNDELVVLDAMKEFTDKRRKNGDIGRFLKEFFEKISRKHSGFTDKRHPPKKKEEGDEASNEHEKSRKIEQVFINSNAKKGAVRSQLNEIRGVRSVPRLNLTEWHSMVFNGIFDELFDNIENDDGVPGKLNTKRADLISAALDSLRSAIRARALRDGLSFFAYKARQWRWRWRHCPREKMRADASTGGMKGRFRCIAIHKGQSLLPVLTTWHMCQPGSMAIAPPNADLATKSSASEEAARKSGAEILFGGCQLAEPDLVRLGVELERSRSRLVVACWSTGHGKGHAASKLADEKNCSTSHSRWVVSFANSCEFDSCFDLIAEMVRLAEAEPNRPVDCVLAQVDLIFNRSQGVPKLIEWDRVFRKLMACKQVNLLVFCEYPKTSEYFFGLRAEIVRNEGGIVDTAPGRQDSPDTRPVSEPSILAEPVAGAGSAPPENVAEFRHIVEQCRSRWLALFLSAVLSDDIIKNEGGGDVIGDGGENFNEFSKVLLDDIEHTLRLVQDPRQRTPSVVDTVMAHLERRVILHGRKVNRLTKILAHAILKHLFAFGSSVDRRVLIYCPEIEKILKDYEIPESERKGYIDLAVKWLLKLHLIVKLRPRSDQYDKKQVRLGLHSQMRRYLASKKSLPFALVKGREHTALTLLPVIDEEVVPLDTDDLSFLGLTFDALIKASDPDVQMGAVQRKVNYRRTNLHTECVRAAFGLMRGSLRIGIVLRATPRAEDLSEGSPLDKYFQRLLALRRAVLRLGEYAGTDADRVLWPLYEREWVWLINEMGVVRMLQGSVHDARPLFELALHFEERRLKQQYPPCYEGWIHQDWQSDFSVTKLRILLNLTLALIEHGEFSRVERIVQRAKLDLDSLTPDSRKRGEEEQIQDKKRVDRNKHRELRVLRLLCVLIESRIAYLAGSIGTVNNWLKEQRAEAIDLGVHGLTALFFQIQMDVHLGKGMLKEAAESLKVTRTEAEASGRPDLILTAMLSECEYCRDARVSDNALSLRHNLARLRKVELEAKRLGMVRAEVTAYLVRAKLYLGFGELRSAREDIMNVLTLANTHGLRVKRVTGLVAMAALLGASNDQREPVQRKEAIELVETARLEAERMGYKMAAVSAKELEIVLRGQGAIEDWASGRFMREAAAPNSGSAAG